MEDPNPYQSPQADQERDTPDEVGMPQWDEYARRKRNCLTFLIVWQVISGIIFGFLPPDLENFLHFVDGVIFLIAIIQWTFIDAAQHRFRLWQYFVLMMVICPGPLIIMPVYFFKTRDVGGALKACGLAVLFVLLITAINVLVSIIAILLLQQA